MTTQEISNHIVAESHGSVELIDLAIGQLRRLNPGTETEEVVSLLCEEIENIEAEVNDTVSFNRSEEVDVSLDLEFNNSLSGGKINITLSYGRDEILCKI